MLGRRAGPERGEVRYLILDVLAAGPAHGYQILQTIEERSGGAYRPSPGTVYPTLQLLEEMELVTVTRDGKRKLHTITEAGLAELEEHRDEVDEAWERFAGHADWTGQFDFPDLARRVKRLFRAVNRGFRRGRLGASEMGRIKETIDQAISAIETILACDEPEE
jgi:DNA-binding PadR family transcriptional regulator